MLRLPGWQVLGTGLLALAVAASGGCSSNPFSSGPSNFDVTFISAAETWDLDKDAVVTCTEWQQYAARAHAEADGNGDGSLTAEEYATMRRNDRLFEVAGLKYFDSNSDGRVSRDEMGRKKNRAFELLDKNNDCKIERNEKVQVRRQVKPKDTDHSGEAAKTPGASGPGPGR
ncbi:MAG: histidine kinase [Alphaproteobacteria bacterium]|nr:histidine kinase [Alphaproteobacteria bacterium]